MKRSIEDHCSLSRIVFPETDSKILCRVADLPFVDPQTFSRPKSSSLVVFSSRKSSQQQMPVRHNV
jgi:hypothetical protein